MTVKCAAANGTATAGRVYVATSGTPTFAAGARTQTATVAVKATTYEPDEPSW